MSNFGVPDAAGRAEGRPAVGEGRGPRMVNALWALSMIKDIGTSLAPQLMNQVSIVIVGQPKSDLTKLYRLALSLATGTIKPFQFNSNHSLMVEADYTNRVIIVELTFSASGIFQANSGNSGPERMRKGFPDEIKGAGFPYLIAPANIAIAPADGPLFTGDVILTTTPSSNPSLLNGNGTYGEAGGADIYQAKAAPLQTACEPIKQPKYEKRPTQSFDPALYNYLRKLFGIVTGL